MPDQDEKRPCEGVCQPDPWRKGGGHTFYLEGVCQTCHGRKETPEEYRARITMPTGRQAWMEAAGPSEGTFEDHAVPETVWMSLAPVGVQSGTYFRTPREREGMVVWRWGGRDPVARTRSVEGT